MLRNYANTAKPTATTALVSPTATTIPVVSTTGYATPPFTITLELGDPAEEFVLVQGKTSNSFTNCIRNYDSGGSDGTGVEHDSGVAVEHTTGAIDYREANAHIFDTTRDDHTQYLNEARLALIDLYSQLKASLIPVGCVIPYFGTVVPAGYPGKWLRPYGQAISRTTYAELFALIGTTQGNGNGTTTFNLPDLRGKTFVILDNLGGSAAGVMDIPAALELGGIFGARTATLSIAQLPSHTHGAGDIAVTNSGAHAHTLDIQTGGGHTHGVKTGASDGSNLSRASGFGGSGTTSDSASQTDNDGSHQHGGSAVESGSAHVHNVSGISAAAGSGNAHSITQPSIATGALMRVA